MNVIVSIFFKRKEAAFLYHIFHLDQLEVSANAVNLFPHFWRNHV